MPKTKGLPVQRKMVSRITRSGKISTYTQGYHLNPFKRTTTSQGRKQRGDSNTLNHAEKMIATMKEKPSIDKRASLEGVMTNVKIGDSLGAIKSNLITSKTKTFKDVEFLSEKLFKPTFRDSMITPNTLQSNEFSRLINSLPASTESYKIVLNDMVANKATINKSAFSSMINSFSDHNKLQEAMNSDGKVESYDFDELRHDYIARFTNPIEMTRIYNTGLKDNLKSSIIDLQTLKNDLEYLVNGTILTRYERENLNMIIDFTSSEAKKRIKDGVLKSRTSIPVYNEISQKVYKNEADLTFNVYNSIVYEFCFKLPEIDINLQKHIKKIPMNQVTNHSVFNILSVDYYLNRVDKTVWLFVDFAINNDSRFSFVSLGYDFMAKIIDKYNDSLLNNVNESKLSKMELKNKINEVAEDFFDKTTSNINDDQYLILV